MRTYTLDPGDVIVGVGGDWDMFSLHNGGPARMSDEVTGQVLWRFVAGAETIAHLDRTFYDVRKTQTALGLLYRCDSPETERVFQMKIEPGRGGLLTVCHSLIRARPRQLQVLRNLQHLFYRKCSQCLAFNFGGPWVRSEHYTVPAEAKAVDAVCPACDATGAVPWVVEQGDQPRRFG